MCFKFFRTISKISSYLVNKFIKIITKKTKGDKDTVETNSINDSELDNSFKSDESLSIDFIKTENPKA